MCTIYLFAYFVYLCANVCVCVCVPVCTCISLGMFICLCMGMKFIHKFILFLSQLSRWVSIELYVLLLHLFFFCFASVSPWNIQHLIFMYALLLNWRTFCIKGHLKINPKPSKIQKHSKQHNENFSPKKCWQLYDVIV